MKFKNAPILINGNLKFASEGSINEQKTLTRIPELYLKTVSTIPSSRVIGSFSATYYLSDNDSDVRSLTGIQLCSGAIGELGFQNGLLKNYSISVSPFNIIQATVNIDFFSPIQHGLAVTLPEPEILPLAHGSRSDVSNLVFNKNPFSFDYSINQTINPLFLLGNSGIEQYEFQEGSIECNLNGTGIVDAMEFCDDGENIVLSLKTTCNTSLGTITEQGLRLTDSNMSLNKDDDLVASVKLIKYF